MVRSTYRPEVIGDIGGFGGMFAFPQHRFTNQVLVSSTDGVGTKALVAQAVGKFETSQITQLVRGVAEGCCQAGCALIGGEMAEHPGAMEPGEFDLVGFAVGVAERDTLITGEHVSAGDVLIGLPSPGLRSNGYSLARKALLEVGGRHLDEP